MASPAAASAELDADDADHLRVTRTGDTWRFEASGDGESWSVLGSFTHDLALTAAGVFAGSTTTTSPARAMSRGSTIEVAGDPIVDEDASVGGDPAPTANDDAFTTAADTALVLTVASDLLGNDTDDDPLTVTGYGTPQFGTLTPSADGSTVTYTPNPGHSGPTASATPSPTAATTATPRPSPSRPRSGGTGPRIDVWYGPEQTFGQRGEAQSLDKPSRPRRNGRAGGPGIRAQRRRVYRAGRGSRHPPSARQLATSTSTFCSMIWTLHRRGRRLHDPRDLFRRQRRDR